MVRSSAFVDLGFMLLMFKKRIKYGTISLLYFSARRSCITEPEIHGCDERILEDRRQDMHSRGKGLVAGFEDCQKNEKWMFLALTSSASRETWYAAGAMRLGTQQV